MPKAVATQLKNANSLRELGVLATSLGLDDALAQPLRRLWERPDRPDLLGGLGEVLEPFATLPLGEVLDDGELLKELKRLLPDEVRRALHKGVRLMLESPETLAPSPAPGPASVGSQAIPTTARALNTWARPWGLRQVLEERVAVLWHELPGVFQGVPSHHLNLSIGALLTLERPLEPQRRFRELREEVWGWLQERALEAQSAAVDEARRLARPAPSFDHPALAAAWTALLAARRRLRTGLPPLSDEALDKCEARYVDDPPSFLVRTPVTAASALRSHPSGMVTVGPIGKGLCCECKSRYPGQPACIHELAAVEVALEHLRGVDGEALARLVADLDLAPWERRLRRLRRVAAVPRQRGGEGARLLWVLEKASEWSSWTLTPTVQRKSKRGGYTAGKRVRPGEIAKDEAMAYTEAERRAAMHLEDGRRYYDDSSVVQALRELIGSAGLRLAGRGDEPVRIQESDLSLDCVDRGDEGFALVPAVDGRPVERRTLLTTERFTSAGLRFLLVDEDHLVCHLVRVPRPVASAISQLERDGFEFPKDAADGLVETLVDSGLPVTLPPSLVGRAVAAAPQVVVSLTPLDGQSFLVETRVRVLAGGLPLPAGEGPAVVRGQHGGERVFVERDFEGERRAVAAVLEKLELGASGSEVSGLEALETMKRLELLQKEEGLEVTWPPRRPVVLRSLRLDDLSVQVGQGRDWFGLQGAAQIDGHRVELAAILEAARRRRRYVQVGPSTWVELKADVQARLAPLAELTFPGTAGDEVSLAAATVLADLEPELAEVDCAPPFQKLVERMTAASQREAAVPAELAGVLRPYQADGYRWLTRLTEWSAGACLADDMGLGKTLQALALLVHRRALGPAVVVAPTSVCFNWEREAERFATGLRIVSYRHSDRTSVLDSLGPGDVLVVSYGLLTNDVDSFAGHRFATVVLDEAQAVKNAASLRARAVRSLEADFRVALTGTPLENHLEELWAVFRAASPGLLGSQQSFRERFATPIERHGDTDRRRALGALLRPFILRRSKAEVARELPPRTEVLVPITLSAEERRCYEDSRLAAIAELTGAGAERSRPEQRRFAVLAALTRLRLLACHSELADSDSPAGESSKLARFLELIDELREEGHRALVFSQFVKHLDLARRALEARRVPFQYLVGATPEGERRRMIDAFQAGEGDVFLLSLKAGGTGINLTAADYVIHLDPWWNPAVEDQASDRAHRIGQTKPVTIYRLVARGTVEDQIVALHERKRALVAGVLEGTGSAAPLDVDELLALLREGVADGEPVEG